MRPLVKFFCGAGIPLVIALFIIYKILDFITRGLARRILRVEKDGFDGLAWFIGVSYYCGIVTIIMGVLAAVRILTA